MDSLQTPQDATDIFSLSDQVLAEKFQFVQEIGFGNWGSVWLCRPKADPSSSLEGVASTSTSTNQERVKVAVKLVHRAKTPTTAARVRSLWNEMKIVRALKQDGHPSIIPFYSFIITPSYALITMAYHPRLIPVEVDEPHAKEWFRSLLSGVEFLHKRGVVHNDIKPANILLSKQNVPVLIDFGFAEKYDVHSSKAFHSNLAYGTPEYLSPERARGLPHDTRKSDVWSLGVTFFEILIGRTPFEYTEGEQFATKEDLEKYWARTMKGKWVGSWKMSKTIERLLKRMILPNADLRCTSSDAMADVYWTKDEETVSSHKRTSSVQLRSPSVVDILSPWSTRRSVSRDPKDKPIKADTTDKRQRYSPESPGYQDESKLAKVRQELAPAAAAKHKRSSSQSKLQALKASLQNQKENQSQGLPAAKPRGVIPSHVVPLSPIQASPPSTPPPRTHRRKENNVKKENVVPATVSTPVAGGSASRKPLGPRAPLSPTSGGQNTSAISIDVFSTKRVAGDKKAPVKDNHRGARALVDTTKQAQNVENGATDNVAKANDDKVKQRVRDWEKWREMERSRDQEGDENAVDDEVDRERERAREREKERLKEKEKEKERLRLEKERRKEEQVDKENVGCPDPQPLRSPIGSEFAMPLNYVEPNQLPLIDRQSTRAGNDSGLSVLRQNFKMSIDKKVQSAKSSLMGQLARISTPALTMSGEGPDSGLSSPRESWEEAVIRDANCTLPVVHDAIRNERVGADAKADRMTIWMQNVEKVVEDARQNFASAKALPPLPLAPASRVVSEGRSQRSSRLPRKILAASQIFAIDAEQQGLADQTWTSVRTTDYLSANHVADQTIPVIPSEEPSRAPVDISFEQTSSRPRRRATVSTGSPEKLVRSPSLTFETGSPSRRKEKSKSINNLVRPISPIAKLHFELERQPMPMPTTPTRLSAVFDKSLFVADPRSVRRLDQDIPEVSITREKSMDIDELTSSPLHVEPYPARKPSMDAATNLDSPARRHVEGVYDRFLMATSGVKRVGRGYQSDNNKPMLNVPEPASAVAGKRHQPSLFHSTRRPMPPPVSSEDWRKSVSVDELGMITNSGLASPDGQGEQGNNTMRIMRRALKAIVPGKVATRA